MSLSEKLAKVADMLESEVFFLAGNAEKEYSCYSIKKKNGKRRLICAPSERLKKLQTAICQVVFSKYKVSKFSTAYELGDNVQHNAFCHRKARHIFKADIESFFPSINCNMVDNILKKKYSPREIDLIWRLCSYGGGLPIGSPASPCISNRVMIIADKKLAKAGKGCVFTRYADDLTFSSKKYINVDIAERVESVLRDFEFKINRKKSKFASLNTGIHITGLTLSNDGNITVGSKYKRRLKKLWHNFSVKKIGKRRSLLGKKAFLDYTETT